MARKKKHNRRKFTLNNYQVTVFSGLYHIKYKYSRFETVTDSWDNVINILYS
jgi:hypothetical protein